MRKAKRHAPPRSEPLNTPALKAEIIRLIKAGCTATEVCQRADMPSSPTLYDWKRSDAVFAGELEAAMIESARVILEDAADMVREAAEPVMEIATGEGGEDAGTIGRMQVETSLARARTAAIMFEVAKGYAEKVAPRQFGQLVKMAGVGEDGAITLNIVNYGSKTPKQSGVSSDAEGPQAGEG